MIPMIFVTAFVTSVPFHLVIQAVVGAITRNLLSPRLFVFVAAVPTGLQAGLLLSAFLYIVLGKLKWKDTALVLATCVLAQLVQAALANLLGYGSIRQGTVFSTGVWGFFGAATGAALAWVLKKKPR